MSSSALHRSIATSGWDIEFDPSPLAQNAHIQLYCHKVLLLGHAEET